jgi:hypothetical protein
VAVTVKDLIFILLIRSRAGERMARVVIESLRTFGGELGVSPVWVFVSGRGLGSQTLADLEGVNHFTLELETGYSPYPFAQKVYACAQAEAMAGADIRSLVWLSLDSLIVNPPTLFDLGPASGAPPAEAAFRPVHHINIGSPAQEPLDDFWRAIYRALEVGEMPYTVESFVDRLRMRPYLNSHCFAFDPAIGLCQAWKGYFGTLVGDEDFQAGPCRDDLHQIFLHQAILSTLAATMLPWERIRLLPPAYNYPLHMLHDLPADLRAPKLNDLVTAVYEDRFPWEEIEIEEPLRAWLAARLPEE